MDVVDAGPSGLLLTVLLWGSSLWGTVPQHGSVYRYCLYSLNMAQLVQFVVCCWLSGLLVASVFQLLLLLQTGHTCYWLPGLGAFFVACIESLLGSQYWHTLAAGPTAEGSVNQSMVVCQPDP